MKSGDALKAHREKLRELHALFTKKAQYHKQKSFLELPDIRWLVHEFFTTFLGKDAHLTEDEYYHELVTFKHEYIVISPALAQRWQVFLEALSAAQYTGGQPSQQDLQSLLADFTNLLDETLREDQAPQDAFTEGIAAAHLLIRNGDLARAEAAYRTLVTRYEAFGGEQKKAHYEQLERLYEAIVALRSGAPGAHQ